MRTSTRLMLEWLVIGAAGLLAYFWLIPTQTTPDPFAALQPDFVPRVCVLGILLLGVIQAIRDFRGLQTAGASTTQPASWRVVAPVMAATFMSVLALELAGMAAGAAILVPVLMLVLRERRLLRIAVVSACCVLPFTPLFS